MNTPTAISLAALGVSGVSLLLSLFAFILSRRDLRQRGRRLDLTLLLNDQRSEFTFRVINPTADPVRIIDGVVRTGSRWVDRVLYTINDEARDHPHVLLDGPSLPHTMESFSRTEWKAANVWQGSRHPQFVYGVVETALGDRPFTPLVRATAVPWWSTALEVVSRYLTRFQG